MTVGELLKQKSLSDNSRAVDLLKNLYGLISEGIEIRSENTIEVVEEACTIVESNKNIELVEEKDNEIIEIEESVYGIY